MTTDRRLPFVIDGRRHPTSGPSSELRGAAGQRLVLPVVDDEVADAIIGQPADLLVDVPLHEIVAFLTNVGRNWKDSEYSRRRLYIRHLVDWLGYSEKMAELEANWIAMLLASSFRMVDAVEAELGSAAIVDRWIPHHEADLRAFPIGRVLHVLAGNVPLSGVVSVLRALLTKNVSVVKASSTDPVTPISLALSFLDVDPEHPVARALNVVHWKGGDHSPAVDAVVGAADGICLWGGVDAVAWATAHARPDVELIVFGPRRSVAVIGAEADVEEAARALAHDVCAYDQRACFSMQEALVEGDPARLHEPLTEALSNYETILPRGQHGFDELARASLSHAMHAFAGADVLRGADWAVVSGPMAGGHPLGRTIFVSGVKSLDEVAERVDRAVQTVAVHPWSVASVIRDAVARRGVTRLVELGLSNLFRVGTAHDGMFPLQRLVRLAATEAPSRVHVKGIVVPIDQTKFLEEERFLEFVP